MIWDLYTLWRDSHIELIIHPTSHMFTFVWERTFEFYSFSMHSMLYIRSSDLIYHVTESSYLFSSLSLFFQLHRPWKPPFHSVSVTSTTWYMAACIWLHNTPGYLSFSVWLIELGIVSYRFIHVVENDMSSFFLKTE